MKDEIPQVRAENVIRNLKKLMILKGMSQVMLGKIVNVSGAAVSHWFSGKNGITYDNLYQIADFFNMSVDEFYRDPETGESQQYTDNMRYNYSKNRLPLLSWVQAGVWSESTVYTDIQYIDTPLKSKNEKCFVLQVRGDSMSRATGKSYFDGCYILVNPQCSKNKEDLNHKVVVARDGNNATLKEFILDGNTPYLRPYNTTYPTLVVTETTEIIGVVVGMWSE